ncbi:MAG: LysM peptidoglycan-binding domain-containing protein [Chitinophagaceae bacterium]|nr:LysM peptidoglycan-binding domain-containing protein [Anaerolineae bacterium]
MNTQTLKQHRVWLLIALAALFAVIIGAQSVSADSSPVLEQASGCVVNTAWPTYTVVGGDTISRIARRFGTTTRDLINANCLANANRIYRGQLLRVPPTNGGGTSNNPVPNENFSVGVSYQAFESGFMIWRGDTGAIWVFGNNGLLQTYLLRTYGGLPTTRYPAAPPASRYRPSNGFRQVWDNFADARTLLGYALTAGESGYIMSIQTPANRAYQLITLPDSAQQAQLSQNRWTSITSGDPVVGTTGAAYQEFENGYMVWRADNNEIWVFSGRETGTMNRITTSLYGSLPDNPVSDSPPSGRVSPVRGFGKVWGSFPNIRLQLGWAIGSEEGFTMTVQQVLRPTGYSFAIPRERTITMAMGGFRVDGTILPLPVPSPTNYLATAQQFENGYMIWNASSGEIWVLIGQENGRFISFPLNNYGNLPVIAPTNVLPGRYAPLMGFNRIWANIPDIRPQLGWAVAPEVSYTLGITTLNPTSFTFNIPNGRVATRTTSGWQFNNAPSLPFEATPEATPEPTLITPEVTPEITPEATAVIGG